MSQMARREQSVSPELLIRQDDVARVYLANDTTLDVRYELGEGTELSPECKAFLAQVRIAEALPTSYLSLAHRRPWKVMLGEAASLAIGGDLTGARAVFADANAFLTNRAGEAARMWYVQASVACVLVLLLLYGVVDSVWQVMLEPATSSSATTGTAAEPSARHPNARLDEDDIYTIKYILLATIGGVVGAGFSILVRVGKLNIDPSAGRNAHYGEVLYRLTIGALAGFIIIVGWQAEVFATFMKFNEHGNSGDAIRASAESFRSDFWKMTIMALAAGASERMVPSLLRQLAERTVEHPPVPPDNQPAA